MEIEPKIKKLVDLLNNISHIRTFSSGQGHFSEAEGLIYGEPDKYACILFRMHKSTEREFEQLAYTILSQTLPHWIKFIVDINKKYHYTPEKNGLNYYWRLEIIPFKATISIEYSAENKRKDTDAGIKLLEDILEKI